MSISRRIALATFGYRGAETRYVEQDLSVSLTNPSLTAAISIPSLSVALTEGNVLNIDLQENGLDLSANLTVEGAI